MNYDRMVKSTVIMSEFTIDQSGIDWGEGLYAVLMEQTYREVPYRHLGIFRQRL